MSLRSALNHFVEDLEHLRERDDRARLARLRRGLGKPVGAAVERDGWVISHLPQTLAERDNELHRCCLIASLFALHPQPGGSGSFGANFRQLRERNPRSDGPERRFVAILNSHVDDLTDRLRHGVALLRSEEIPVDWRSLLAHVRHWDHPERWVQVRWSRDFWAVPDAEIPEEREARVESSSPLTPQG